MDSSTLTRLIAATIGAAAVLNEPFPHAVIDGIFPEEVYVALSGHWPGPEVLRPITEMGTRGEYEQRLALELFEGTWIEALPQDGRAVWRAVRAALSSEEVCMTCLKLFAPVMRERLATRDPGGAASLGARAVLMEDHESFAMGPHTDAANKLATALFYLPTADENAHAGTTLYRPKDPDFRCPGGPHHSFDSFDRVQTISYRRNRLFLFAKTDRSFHGVELLDRLERPRRVITLNISLAA